MQDVQQSLWSPLGRQQVWDRWHPAWKNGRPRADQSWDKSPLHICTQQGGLAHIQSTMEPIVQSKRPSTTTGCQCQRGRWSVMFEVLKCEAQCLPWFHICQTYDLYNFFKYSSFQHYSISGKAGQLNEEGHILHSVQCCQNPMQSHLFRKRLAVKRPLPALSAGPHSSSLAGSGVSCGPPATGARLLLRDFHLIFPSHLHSGHLLDTFMQSNLQGLMQVARFTF